MNDLAIIIQGPLNPISIGNIPNYKKFGKVFVSCWEDDDESLISAYQDIVHIKNSWKENLDISNPQNLYRQTITTLSGLHAASDYKYCIKVRSDEYYSDLTLLIEKIKSNPSKIICSNIYFRQKWRMHISDHILGSTRENLLKTFNLVKAKCELPGKVYKHHPPEVLITTSFLQACKETCLDHVDRRNNTNEEKKIISQYFDIIPIRVLGKIHFKIQYPGGKHIYLDKEDHSLMSIDSKTNGPCIFNSVSEL